jgi:hypothetical protein
MDGHILTAERRGGRLKPLSARDSSMHRPNIPNHIFNFPTRRNLLPASSSVHGRRRAEYLFSLMGFCLYSLNFKSLLRVL